VATTTTTREGISIALVREPSVQTSGIVTVSLPNGTAATGIGFSFPLPAQVAATTTNNAAVRITTASGGSLPSWLRFDATTKTFVASAVPDGAFPMQVLITIGTQQTALVISERISQ
jgi:Putative Ig domain